MKISASVYSDSRHAFEETIRSLDAHQVDLFHVDCNDDLTVFDDIQTLRTLSDIPVDLHIITPTPSKFYQRLLEVPVEYVTFQLEPLEEPLVWPKELSASKGVAITTPTSVDLFSLWLPFRDNRVVFLTRRTLKKSEPFVDDIPINPFT